MQNTAGEDVELYIPRKCSSSSRIIAANDHAAIQLEIANVDPATGHMISGPKIEPIRYAICGKIRFMGASDAAIVRLAQEANIIPKM